MKLSLKVKAEKVAMFMSWLVVQYGDLLMAWWYEKGEKNFRKWAKKKYGTEYINLKRYEDR